MKINLIHEFIRSYFNSDVDNNMQYICPLTLIFPLTIFSVHPQSQSIYIIRNVPVPILSMRDIYVQKGVTIGHSQLFV